MDTSKTWPRMVGVVLFFMSLPAFGESSDEVKVLSPVSGRPATVEGILPADVLARVQLLRDEVELVRREMGRPKCVKAEMLVSGAAPREVFFQALTLFQKADRLAFEHTGFPGEEPETVPAKQIRPFHVMMAVDAALGRIRTVKEKLGIAEQAREQLAPVETTPSQVLILTVRANRQINLLLENPYAPRDVYREVSRLIHYAARLLAQYPGVERIPDPPPFERFKTPSDVYAALLDGFEIIQQLAELQGLVILDIEEGSSQAEGASPSDVYDMATLLVSELSFLHAQVPGIAPPVPVYDPGRKFPSHVYQRAGILKQQLEVLLKQAERKE